MFKKMLMLAALSLSLFSAEVKLNLNAKYGANNFHTLGAIKFAKLVEQYTNGEVKITVHPGSSLVGGNPLKAVKDGSVAMTDMFIPFTSGGGKIFGISALPFVVSSYDEAFKLYEIAKPAYEKVAKKWNQKFLYIVSWPPTGLYTNKKVEKLRDLKGIKARTYDKNSANFIAQAGGSAVALPWGDVYSALQTGMVDSVVTSSASGKDGKFWEVLKNFTKINYAFPLQGVTINLDYYNSLTKAQQNAMLKAASEIEKAQWEASKKEDEDALALLKENKMQVNEASSELKKELNVVAKKMLDEYLKEADKATKKVFEEFDKK